MNELRDIPGYEGRYAITADGRVWAHARSWSTGKGGNIQRQHAGRWLRTFPDARGYVRVNLKVNGDAKSVHRHRLIALAWIPNPDNHPQVNHLNGVKGDDRADNLEWCTASHNKRHAVAMGLCPVTPVFLASVRRNVLKAHAATRGKPRVRRAA